MKHCVGGAGDNIVVFLFQIRLGEDSFQAFQS